VRRPVILTGSWGDWGITNQTFKGGLVFALLYWGLIMFEVFDPRDGLPVFTTRFQWLARLMACVLNLDWARAGEGYVS
jgi:hypothetical protein